MAWTGYEIHSLSLSLCIYFVLKGKKEVYTSERVREILFAWVILTLAIMREQQQTLLIQV